MLCFPFLLVYLRLGSCNIVWHIPTPNEGVVSHFLSLLRLRSLMIKHKRNVTIKEALFHSSLHYPDLGEGFVNLCEIFKPPREVSCTNATYLEIVSHSRCVSDNRTTFHLPEDYGLPAHSFRIIPGHQIKYSVLNCHVGFVLGHGGHASMYPEFGFQDRYVSLWPHIKAAVKGDSLSTFAVIHWRRGDQLISRCTDHSPGRPDKSINCAHNASDFVIAVKNATSHFCPEVKRLFVATNEKNPANLRTLRANGFTVLSDVTAKVGKSSTGRPLNSLDAFVVELMIICESRYFLAWGVNVVHEIPRVFCTGPGKIRIIDDKVMEAPN